MTKTIHPFYSGFRRKARVIKCKTLLVDKRGFIVPGVPRVDRENWERERGITSVTECGVLRRTFWHEKRFFSHTKMSIFFGKGRSTNYIARKSARYISSRSKRCRSRYDLKLRKLQIIGRQWRSPCAYCCYYLEQCSKTNHIAMKTIKRAKYENALWTWSLLKHVTWRKKGCHLLHDLQPLHINGC